jgi:TetR/AcrR family transcriptional repressor of nem operon
MAAAVARRYGDRFFEVVARRDDESGDDAIAIYRSAFRSAIERDGRMCLNGVLGAEAGGLPPEVVAEIKMFFRRCIDDLSSRIGGADAVARAFHVMAALEGGLILARAYHEHLCVRSGDGEAYRAHVRSRLMIARKRAVMIPASS